MRSIALGLTWMLSGCGCPPLDAAPVTDPDGVAADGQLDGIRVAIADFLAWSGGPDVCVPEVRVTGAGELEGALGRWDGDGRPLLIAGHLSDPYATAIHELCHAWDEGAGYPSEWASDRFDPATVTDVDAYPTRGLRIREAFARTCEDGVRDARLVDDARSRCSLWVGDDADDWVARAVYARAAPPPPATPVPVTLDRRSLDGTLGDLRLLDAVSDDAVLWLLAVRGRPLSPLQPQRIHHVLLGVDPATGAVVASGLLRRPPDERHRFRLVGGRPAALLLEETESGTTLHALSAPEGIGPQVASLPFALRWDGVVRDHDRLIRSDVDDATLWSLDLVAGVEEVVPLDPPLATWQRPFGDVSLAADGRVLLGGFTARTGAGALLVDPDTGAWEGVPLPRGAEAGRVASLPDGRLLTTTSLTLPGNHRLRGIAAVDGAGGLWLPAGCAADRVATQLRLFAMPDGLWLLEDADPDSGVPVGRWLTRVDVGG
jgi:hypothetical protein